VLGGSASIYSVTRLTVTADINMNDISDDSDKKTFLPLSLSGVINNGNTISLETASDVALVAIFDPLTLKHRLREEEDWWNEDSELIKEMNRGNGIFLSTGYDGYYEVLIHGEEPRILSSAISLNLVCEGELFYVGGYPADGIKKVNAPFGGDYISCEKGIYKVEVRRRSHVVDLSFLPVQTFSRNNLDSVPHFDEFN